MFWASVKDSTSPAVLSAYLDRYPNGEFAPIAPRRASKNGRWRGCPPARA
jgi:hypothetical protein